MNSQIKVYLMMDYASEFKKKVANKEYPPNFLFGGAELEREKILKIVDQNIKNVFFSGRRAIFIVNRIKYIPLLKILGKKVIYININSNHDLEKISLRGLKNYLLKVYYLFSYKICDRIVCLSPTQIKKLKKVGIKRISTIPLGVEEKIINETNINTNRGFYLSAGLDEGRNFNFIKSALKDQKVIILNKENRLSYLKYLKVLSECKALVINIEDNNRASDLSGITTCCEALLMKKPVFINNQPWLKKLLKENYYVYKDKKSLEKLIKKKINFKEMNIEHLTLKNFMNGLVKEINNLK